MTLQTLADGSIQDGTGRIVCFSLERFVDQICINGHCFLCGAAPDSVPFNEEHVIPDWVLRRFGLHGQTIELPNGTPFKYSAYVLPCCATCNARLGACVEVPIRTIIHGGYSAVVDELRANGPWRFFRWLALLFLKTHLKDRLLRIDRDQRLHGIPISSLYDWTTLHQVHNIVSSIGTACVYEPEAMGSTFVLRVSRDAKYGRFDFVDLYQARALLVRMDEICIVSVLDDACAGFSVLHDKAARITAPLHPVQQREWLAQVAFANTLLKHRPVFTSRIDAGTLVLGAELPAELAFREFKPGEFGQFVCHCMTGLIAKGEPDGLLEKLRTGRGSTLFDGERFIDWSDV